MSNARRLIIFRLINIFTWIPLHHLRYLTVYWGIILLISLVSCSSEADPIPAPPVVQQPSSPDDPEHRVWIVNEGNFQRGNASLDIYFPERQQLQSDAFASTNGRPLGDVFQSLTIYQDRAYLVINNSNKIEVVDAEELTEIGTIDGLVSPRFFLPVADDKAYVSDLFGNAVAIVDLNGLNVSGQIALPGWTEQIGISERKKHLLRMLEDLLSI